MIKLFFQRNAILKTISVKNCKYASHNNNKVVAVVVAVAVVSERLADFCSLD